MCESNCSIIGCWGICFLAAIAWWLFASGLLLCAWNSVVAKIANVKKAKYWQALVIVLALVVLCGPFVCGKHMCLKARHRDECCKSNCSEMKRGCGQNNCDPNQYKTMPKSGE